MKRRIGPAPAIARRRAAVSSDASASSKRWGGREFVTHFIFLMVCSGVVGAFFSSWFPIALGLFLFFTNDEFIEWVLEKIGIRLLPDTLGAEFIKALVFMLGLAALLAYWRESAPQWLLAWIPPGTPPWSAVGGAALFCAVLN